MAESPAPAGLKWVIPGVPTMVPTRALALSPVAWTVELEAPRGRARGKDEVEKRGFPDAAPTKSETNRIHRTVARRGESESNVCAPGEC